MPFFPRPLTPFFLVYRWRAAETIEPTIDRRPSRNVRCELHVIPVTVLLVIADSQGLTRCSRDPVAGSMMIVPVITGDGWPPQRRVVQ